MSRDRRDDKGEAQQAGSRGESATAWAKAASPPMDDAAYQAQCSERILQFLSAPLPLTPSEREAKQGAASGTAPGVHAAAERGVAGPSTALPHGDNIQAAFGPHDVSGIQAHVGGAAADACGKMGASAYATGNQVAFAGQPDLHTAAHEAAHVVQQRQGVQLYGGVGQVGDVYERQADAVADAVVAGQSATELLSNGASTRMSGPAGVATRSVQAFGGLYLPGTAPASPAPTTAKAGPNVNRLVPAKTTVEFGPTPLGATNYQEVTFTNQGTEAVEPGDFVVQAGLNAQADDFAVAGGDATSGAPLAPGEAISLQVAFHPHPRPDQDPKRWPGRVAHLDVLDMAGARAGSVRLRGRPRPTDEATQVAHEAAELAGASRHEHADRPAPITYTDMLAHLQAANELLATGDREHAQDLIHAVRARMQEALRDNKIGPKLRGFGLGAQGGTYLINQAYDAVVDADVRTGADWRVDGAELVARLEQAREPIQFVLGEIKDAPTLRAFHDASPVVMAGHVVEGLAEHTIEMVTDAEYTVGYLSGLVEGAYGAVRDLVMGFADLVGMSADIVKAMWSRGFVGAVQHFGHQVAEIFDKAPELLEALGADFARKWNQHGSFGRGNFRGEVMGYIAMQILLVIATAGEGAAAVAGRWPKVLAVVRTLDAAGDIFTWAETAADGVRALRKGAKAVGDARDVLAKAERDAGAFGLADTNTDAAGTAADTRSRAIANGEDVDRGPRTDKKANRPDLENDTRSMDGRDFHNDIRKMSPEARHVIRQLEDRGWVRVDDIMPEDLVDISKWFEREIGVLQSPYGGKLRIVLGTEDGVLVKQLMPGEVFVVHTHPVVLTKKGHFDLDIPNSGKHIEAVIDWSGQITYFNKTGLKNPVRPDGTVEPLLGYEAAFVNERGAIAGFATIDIVDGPNGTTIKVRE